MVEGEAVFRNRQDSRILEKRLKSSGKSACSKQAAQPPEQPCCPECNSTRLYKDGLRYLTDGTTVQRWLCRNCGLRFSQTVADLREELDVASQAFKRSDSGKRRTRNSVRYRDFSVQDSLDELSLTACENVRPHDASTVGEALNILCSYSRSNQVCASEKAKNLAEVARRETGQREGTTQTADIKGKILQFLWHLEKENRSKRTIVSYSRYLDMLMKIGADLDNPESVKEVVARREKWGENTRRMAMAVYRSFAIFNGLHFTPPKYRINQKLPFIPLEAEIDALIVASTRRLATALQLLKEVPIRIGEALTLKWTDIDLERRCIIVNNTEKNGKPRAFKVSQKLFNMLNSLPKKNEKVFGLADYKSMENQFVVTRKRTANKLQNPRLMQIHFHTLRHWKATMEYHKTRDILHVMNLLGHRNIESTLVYTQLISFQSDEYHSAVAKTVEEARKLLETGFEYICQKDDIMLFRKRK